MKLPGAGIIAVLAIYPLCFCATEVEGQVLSFSVATFNISVGQFATAQTIATELAPLNLDLLVLTECPTLIDSQSGDEEFVAKITGILDMKYWAMGTISSGNHWKEWGTDITKRYHGKLKAVLSRTPITRTDEFPLTGRGWSSGAFRIETTLAGRNFAVYALHIPGSDNKLDNSVHKDFVDKVLSREMNPHVLLMGDFNDEPSNATMKYITDQGYRVIWDDLSDQDQRFDLFLGGKIDHILYRTNDSLIAVDGRSVFRWPRISDHPYVWAHFCVTTTRPATP